MSERLRASIARLLAASPETASSAAVIAAAASTAPGLAPPRSVPVVRHLAEACRLAKAGPHAAVAEELLAIAPTLDWMQNAGYVAAPPDHSFLDNYGYVELAGPDREIKAPGCRVGFLLLGPATHYPAHHHPAEEFYYVIAGRADWWRAGEGWSQQGPGATIHHLPHVQHATRCHDEPLLALYCWLGAVEVPARFI